jgi:uncharacterized protein YbgA (DUF1722 family)/uncharacterized protein YbbK (DUF523 family)
VTNDPIYIGVSRCLLGDAVRHDAGHKRDALLIDLFGPHVEWVAVCPEVEMGMGIPREPIHLVARSDGVPSAGERVRLVAVRSRHDWTETMQAWARTRTRALAGMKLSGYVLKKDSPSCGMEGVRVHHRAGGAVQVTRTGRGLFAQALMDALPNLPVEDEGRLQDAALRENFVERVFAYQRVRRLFGGRWSRSALLQFHTAHTLQLLAHSRQASDTLGRLVAGGGEIGRSELATRYEATFMGALHRKATPARHADVLRHLTGHLKRLIGSRDRTAIRAAIDDHRRGAVPLIVPLTLIRHHAGRCHVEYLTGQTYLYPDPREMVLRAI